MTLAIPSMPISHAQFQAFLTDSRLCKGPVSIERAGALRAFMSDLIENPGSISMPSDFIDEAHKQARLSSNDRGKLSAKFRWLTEDWMNRADAPLTKADKRAFTKPFVKVLNLPWNTQIAGAFLAFVNMKDEALPTAAAGLFPNFESFRSRSLERPEKETIPLYARYNNFGNFFIKARDQYLRRYSVFRRFKDEEPALEARLTQAATEAHKKEIRSDIYPPAIEAELYQAYQKMASYRDEVRKMAKPQDPARALIGA